MPRGSEFGQVRKSGRLSQDLERQLLRKVYSDCKSTLMSVANYLWTPILGIGSKKNTPRFGECF